MKKIKRNPVIPEEEWRVIEKSSDYAISNCGNVKRIEPGNNGNCKKVGEFLKLILNFQGYLYVFLYPGPKYCKIHHLVLDNFVCKRPKGYQCNHKDGNKQNNCLWNLEWVTYQENIRHAWCMGLYNNKGEEHGQAKLKEFEVRQIRRFYYNNKISQVRLAKKLRIPISCINSAIYKWKHL